MSLEPVGGAIAHALPEPPEGWRQPTPNSIVFHLVDLSMELDRVRADAERYARDWIDAKQAYEVAYSRAILSSGQSSADRRKAEAVVATADLKLHMEITHELMRSAKEAADTIKEQIRVGQSLGAAARAEWAVSFGPNP
ncbi:hypothetical protein [Pseudonocardia sp. D17]|uniref:hypothetical protein n=1 Tax=Pseudonocardia sp. D17 TaxID=882661 RepID=UPI002B3E8FBC|nr:hypothetical protein PSD17_56660 [Pseudonocardia sp. D17]